MIRVLLVDDHALVREGLHRLLQDCGDIEVVGEAGEGQQALRLVRQLQPDVVVMDLSLPGLDGMEVTKRIMEEGLNQCGIRSATAASGGTRLCLEGCSQSRGGGSDPQGRCRR